MIKSANNQKGYVVLMLTFFMLIIMFSVAMSMSFLVLNAQKNTTNSVKATQSYYAAESGIEDALLRLKKNPQMSSLPYQFTAINNIVADVNIPGTIGGSKTITSQADNGGIFKNIQTVASMDNGQGVSFYYGIEVGPGGLELSGNCEVMGNVFSNGNIFQNGGSSTIDNDVVVSGNGNYISNVHVKGNVTSYSCLVGNVDGNLTYVDGGTNTCHVKGEVNRQSTEISQQPMPIPQSQITDWENAAIGSGSIIYNGDYNLSGSGRASLLGPGIINGSVTLASSAVLTTGPIEIMGDLTIGGSAVLNMKGTLYVKGNISLLGSGKIAMDSAYGSLGGVVIADGNINTGGSGIFKGSGQTGSYVLVISNSNSTSAITVSNSSSTGAIFYTTAGTLYLSGNVSVAEATGYAVKMDGSSTVRYSIGLVNVYFSSGPGGAWKITDWQEY